MEDADICSVMIVDDHELTHSGLALLLESAGYKIVASAKTAGEVIPLIEGEPVDLLLLDLGLPDNNGLNILAELVSVYNISVVVVSGSEQGSDFLTALRLGARAVVSKADPTAEIITALHESRHGREYISKSCRVLINTPCDAEVTLSPRQMAILHFLSSGESNKEIGYKLRISAPTVSFHLRELREKIGVDSNKKILNQAKRLNLI